MIKNDRSCVQTLCWLPTKEQAGKKLLFLIKSERVTCLCVPTAIRDNQDLDTLGKQCKLPRLLFFPPKAQGTDSPSHVP